jgi:hypothetical protein
MKVCKRKMYMKEMKQNRLLAGSVFAAIAMFTFSCNQPQESETVPADLSDGFDRSVLPIRENGW